MRADRKDFVTRIAVREQKIAQLYSCQMPLIQSTHTVNHVLFLVPDASRTGAPISLLHWLRWLRQHSDLQFEIALFQDGPLASDFSDVAATRIITDVGIGPTRLLRSVGRLPVLGGILKSVWHSTVTPRILPRSPTLIYANSVVCAGLLPHFLTKRANLLVHVHEMQWAIDVAAGQKGMQTIKSHASRYIASAEPVRRNLIERHEIDSSQIDFVPYAIPIDETLAARRADYSAEMRRRLGIPASAKIIGACGGTSWRKGTDLFVEMAVQLNRMCFPFPLHFVWVGAFANDEFTNAVRCRVHQTGLSSSIHFTGVHPSPTELFCGFDMFVLPPGRAQGLVVLETAGPRRPPHRLFRRSGRYGTLCLQ